MNQKKKSTSDGVIVLGRSKKEAISFSNLLTKGFDGRRETPVFLQIGVDQRQRRDVYVLYLDALHRLAQLNRYSAHANT